MRRTQLLFVFVVLFLVLFLFPLFWGGTGGRSILFPLYLIIGPLMASALIFEGLGQGEDIKDAVQERVPLLPTAFMLSFVGALFFGVVSLFSLAFEWLLLIPVIGSLVQVFLIAWPLLMTLLLIGGIFASLFLIFFAAPQVAKLGWNWKLLSQAILEQFKRSWFLPFLSAVGPFALALLILWLAFPSVTAYLLPVSSPFFALQWLFLSPLLAFFLAYPLAYFFDRSFKWSSSLPDI